MEPATVIAIIVAAVAVLVAIWAVTSRRRLGGAVDDALERIGAESSTKRRSQRAFRLSEAIADLERSMSRARRDRAQLAGALEAADIGILITDDGGVVGFSNDAAQRYLGARQGEAVAEIRIREAIDEAIVTRTEVEREEELFTPRRRVLKLLAVPLELGVESLGCVAYIIDVTEERRVEAMRRDFIANVSHELKTPLGALAVLAETLSNHSDDPAIAARFADRLATESTRLSKLLEDILDLSQAEAWSSTFDPVPIERVVTEAADQMRDRASAHGAELLVEPVPSDAVVPGDRRQLRSMLVNLIDNAIKYSEPEAGATPPKVRVRVTVGDDRVSLAVQDEGIGIPDAHVDRIFERFYRVDRARSRATGGTGLGLSIVRHVSLNHGGTVEVSSKLGEGSVFTVHLPEVDRTMTRVLVVEDEPSFVDALEVSLGSEGFEVAVATDGRQAIEMFRDQRPDFVLLDLMLPSLPGLDVLRAIRRESDTPVIVVSAKDSEADVVTALELGADDYLTKPYSVRELVARIRAAGRRSRPAPEPDTLRVGEATLDLGALRLRLPGVEHDLPKKEFEVLRLLMEYPGNVVTREEFLDQVWGFTWAGDTRSLDQHIRRLRRRLEESGEAPQIETVRGVGYRLVG